MEQLAIMDILINPILKGGWIKLHPKTFFEIAKNLGWSKDLSKILPFILFFGLTHKEIKLYQILAYYRFSIKRFRLGSLSV